MIDDEMLFILTNELSGQASEEEIEFVQNVMAKCKTVPIYGRVDVTWDNDDKLALVELEVIEPELWFRESPDSPKMLAEAVSKYISYKKIRINNIIINYY